MEHGRAGFSSQLIGEIYVQFWHPTALTGKRGYYMILPDNKPSVKWFSRIFHVPKLICLPSKQGQAITYQFALFPAAQRSPLFLLQVDNCFTNAFTKNCFLLT